MRAFWLRVSTPKDASKYFAFSIALAGILPHKIIRYYSGFQITKTLIPLQIYSGTVLCKYLENPSKKHQ